MASHTHLHLLSHPNHDRPQYKLTLNTRAWHIRRPHREEHPCPCRCRWRRPRVSASKCRLAVVVSRRIRRCRLGRLLPALVLVRMPPRAPVRDLLSLPLRRQGRKLGPCRRRSLMRAHSLLLRPRLLLRLRRLRRRRPYNNNSSSNTSTRESQCRLRSRRLKSSSPSKTS